MAKVDAVMRSKFRGCFLGVLFGDCLGGPFEGDKFAGSGKLMAQKYFDFLATTSNVPFRNYTDDFSLTKATAKALIEEHPVSNQTIAKQLVNEYLIRPKRGYSDMIAGVFSRLQETQFSDIFEPAQSGYSGLGSFGNGGAMRVAPIALYFHKNPNKMIEKVKESTKITHAHSSGINGAILQAIAIRQNLLTAPSEKINAEEYLKKLTEEMKKLEIPQIGDIGFYQTQLVVASKLLEEKYKSQWDQDSEVVKFLGTTTMALYSVPTAIFCFLRAQNEIEQVKTDNVLTRAVQYAISLGGDTDTIGSMTGALVGAHLGDGIIPEPLMKHLEDGQDALEISNQLFEAHLKEH